MQLKVWIIVEGRFSKWDKKFENWTGPLPEIGHKIWYGDDPDNRKPVKVDHINWEFNPDYNHVMIIAYDL